MILWLKVTHDEYELPLMIADSLSDMAKRVGTSRNSVASSYSHFIHGGPWSPYRKVVIEEDENDKY